MQIGSAENLTSYYCSTVMFATAGKMAASVRDADGAQSALGYACSLAGAAGTAVCFRWCSEHMPQFHAICSVKRLPRHCTRVLTTILPWRVWSGSQFKVFALLLSFLISRGPVLCRESELPEQEHELRRKSELVSARISAAATLTHTTQCAQHAAAEQNRAAAALGVTFQKLAAFEADNVHVELAEASHAFGAGCQNVASQAAAGLVAAGAVAQVRTFLTPVSQLQWTRKGEGGGRCAPCRGQGTLAWRWAWQRADRTAAVCMTAVLCKQL